MDVLLTRPARSGRTGQRPFGSLGDPIEARSRYCGVNIDRLDIQLWMKHRDLKMIRYPDRLEKDR